MIRPMPDDQRPDDAPSLEAPSLGRLFGRRKGKAADETPMANVMLTLMQSLGLEMDSFGDSTGTFSLSAPSTSDTV